MGMLPKLRRKGTFRLPSSLKRGLGGHWELSGNPRALWDPTKPVTLVELYPQLTSTQKSFFDKLDVELDKVEAFYVEREKEMMQRSVYNLALRSDGKSMIFSGSRHSRYNCMSSRLTDKRTMYVIY